MDWGQALSVVFTGISVVFLILIVLIIAIWAMGKIMGAFTKPAVKTETPAPKAEPVKTEPIVEAVTVQSENGLNDEVVAAIAAAVTCVMEAEGNQSGFTIKSIRRVKGNGNAWNMAGVLDNTRPF